MRRSPFACLARGVRSLRANPSLAVAAWLQQALTLLLTAAGFVPLAAALGVPWRRLAAPPPLARLLDPEAVAAPLADLVLRWPEVAADLALALLAASLLWLAATALFCWFQGGIYGLLDAADRGAPAVTARWPRFRAVSWRGFAAAGRRLALPCFKLIHLYLLAVLVALLAWSLALLVAARLAGPGAELVAAGVGCALLAAVVAPFSLLAFASFWLAQADLPRRGATVGGAVRRSLAMLRRRPADVTVLLAAYLAASLVVAAAAAPLAALAAGAAAHLVLLAVELAAAVALTTAFAAATVALMRDGADEEAAA